MKKIEQVYLFPVNSAGTQTIGARSILPGFIHGSLEPLVGEIVPGKSSRGAAVELASQHWVNTEPEWWTCFHTESRIHNGVRIRTHCMTAVLEDFDDLDTYEKVGIAVINMKDFDFTVVRVGSCMEYLTKMVRAWHQYPEHRWIEG